MDKIKEISMYVLAAIIVLGFFALLYILLYVKVPADNQDILNIVVGALIGSFTAIVGYFFGSSAGSKEKTKLMSNPKQ